MLSSKPRLWSPARRASLAQACTAVVFCGGRGTRLAPFVPGVPKALVLLDRRPYLHGLLMALQRARVGSVLLCISGFTRMVRLYVGSGARYGLTVSYSWDPGTVENAGALQRALCGIGTPLMLCLNGDTIVDVDLEALLEFHVDSCATGTLVVSTRRDQPHPNAVEVCPSGLVRDIHEAVPGPYTFAPGSRGYTNSGVYVFDVLRMRRNWSSVLRQGKLEEGVFRNLAWRRELRAFINDDRFLLDIGTPAGLKRARSELDQVGRFFEL